jgi:hypothetical protein
MVGQIGKPRNSGRLVTPALHASGHLGTGQENPTDKSPPPMIAGCGVLLRHGEDRSRDIGSRKPGCHAAKEPGRFAQEPSLLKTNKSDTAKPSGVSESRCIRIRSGGGAASSAHPKRRRTRHRCCLCCHQRRDHWSSLQLYKPRHHSHGDSPRQSKHSRRLVGRAHQRNSLQNPTLPIKPCFKLPTPHHSPL